MGNTNRDILAFATQGLGSNDGDRLRELLDGFDAIYLQIGRGSLVRRLACVPRILRAVSRARPVLVVVEGTGLAGGMALLLCKAWKGQPYVFGSGDAVAPYLARRSAWLGPAGWIYERLLCRFSAGVIAWTPYLAGRAVSFGAPRAVTIPGWPERTLSLPERRASRAEARERLGIAPGAFVIGIVGSLNWNKQVQYCYGLELVSAIRRTHRTDVVGLIVGDGSGRDRLVQAAGPDLDRRVLLPGAVPRSEVPSVLSAMDIASLPQSVDSLGMFRFSTKLVEYVSAGLPVVTGQTPASYDLDTGWIWRIPGDNPWSERYLGALSALFEGMTADDLARHTENVAGAASIFDEDNQRARIQAFIGDVLASLA